MQRDRLEGQHEIPLKRESVRTRDQRTVREQPGIDDIGRGPQIGRDGRENGPPVEAPGPAGPSGGEEHLLAKVVRLVGRVHLELAAVFEQFGEPLMNELRRVVADRFADLFLDLAPRPAGQGR